MKKRKMIEIDLTKLNETGTQKYVKFIDDWGLKDAVLTSEPIFVIPKPVQKKIKV